MAASSASDYRRHDRLLARRRHRHAFQRHAHDCHGLRRCRARAHSQRKHSHPSTHAMARAHSLSVLPPASPPPERPCRHHSFRRRHFLLGALLQALARRLPPLSSRRSRVFLPHCTPLVHPLRPPQPRFLPHFHYRPQFQALPHARIPAYPAFLVLCPGPSGRCPSLDWNFPVFARHGNRHYLALTMHLGIHLVAHLLGWILRSLFFCIAIETSRLYPPCFSSDWSVDDPRIHSARPGLCKALSTGALRIGTVPNRGICLGEHGNIAFFPWEREIWNCPCTWTCSD